VWGPGSAPVLASDGRPGSWGRPRRGKGVRAVAVRWTRRRKPGVRPRVRGGPAHCARCVNRKGVSSMASPVYSPGRLFFGPPPPSRESSRGSGPRGGGEKAWGKGPCPHTGAYQKRGRRGTDGEAVHYRPSPFHPIATRVESLSLVPLCAGRPHSHCPRPRRPPFPGAAAMASSQSSAVAPTEEMASPSAGRATPAASGTPASATAKSGSPAAGSPWVGEAP